MSVPPKKKLQVVVPVSFSDAFTYEMGDVVCDTGDFVAVPFGDKTVNGVVWAAETEQAPTVEKASYQIKPLTDKHALPALTPACQEFIDRVAAYYMVPRGMVLKMVMSEPSVFKPVKVSQKNDTVLPSPTVVTLSDEQKEAATFLTDRLGGYQTILLEGVTGSGKTEVYLEAIQKVKEAGTQALILLPEIALSTQWLERFERRFGETPVLWHSDLTPAQRRRHWKKVITGEAKVIVGARSALFLPFQKLGLIVVDEEHDSGYKQESGVLYHARDMAVLRGSIEKCLVVLATATPSLETRANVLEGRYQHCEIAHRYGGAVLPDVQLIDRRHPEGKSVAGSRWISEKLFQALKETLEAGNQSLLFLNRRGYAPMLLCQACGIKISCKACESWLVYHKHDHALKCHQCGFSRPLPTACPDCKEKDSLTPCGPGVERVVEEVEALFPEARVALMTSDTMSSLKKSKALVEEVQQKKIDIIVGTQVMAKGHHFPHLTLVGVVDGDVGLTGSDLRLMERTYQLLHQVSGRAGRAEKKGRVMIQSHMTEHPLMQALSAQNMQEFMVFEETTRKDFGFPPYGRLAALIVSGKNKAAVQKIADTLSATRPNIEKVDIYGPVPAVFHKLNHQYRWRFLIKGPKQVSLQKVLAHWLSAVSVPGHVRVQADIDPYNFY